MNKNSLISIFLVTVIAVAGCLTVDAVKPVTTPKQVNTKQKKSNSSKKNKGSNSSKSSNRGKTGEEEAPGETFGADYFGATDSVLIEEEEIWIEEIKEIANRKAEEIKRAGEEAARKAVDKLKRN